MPEFITNPEIIELINQNETNRGVLNQDISNLNKRREDFVKCEEAIAIEEEDKRIQERCKQYDKNVAAIRNFMDATYGWGNWNNLNVKDYSFINKEEMEADPEFKKKYHTLPNPAIRPKVILDDVRVEVTPAPEEEPTAPTIQ